MEEVEELDVDEVAFDELGLGLAGENRKLELVDDSFIFLSFRIPTSLFSS